MSDLRVAFHCPTVGKTDLTLVFKPLPDDKIEVVFARREHVKATFFTTNMPTFIRETTVIGLPDPCLCFVIIGHKVFEIVNPKPIDEYNQDISTVQQL